MRALPADCDSFIELPAPQMKKLTTSHLNSTKRQRLSLLISQKVCYGSTSIVVNPCEYEHLNFHTCKSY